MSQTTGREAGAPNRSPQPAKETAQRTGEQAKETAQRAGEQAKKVGEDAANKAGEVAQEAKSQGREAVGAVKDTAKEKASSMAEGQKENLSGRLEDFAEAVHRSGSELEGHQDWLAHLVEHGAAELKMLADSLRKNDLHSLLEEVGSLAHRQPALFVGASMAAGVALTRIGRVAVTKPAPVSSHNGSGQSSNGSSNSSEVANERR